MSAESASATSVGSILKIDVIICFLSKIKIKLKIIPRIEIISHDSPNIPIISFSLFLPIFSETNFTTALPKPKSNTVANPIITQTIDSNPNLSSPKFLINIGINIIAETMGTILLNPTHRMFLKSKRPLIKSLLLLILINEFIC